jgi:hypothetical protein
VCRDIKRRKDQFMKDLGLASVRFCKGGTANDVGFAAFGGIRYFSAMLLQCIESSEALAALKETYDEIYNELKNAPTEPEDGFSHQDTDA